jgi:hypothetical protein
MRQQVASFFEQLHVLLAHRELHLITLYPERPGGRIVARRSALVCSLCTWLDGSLARRARVFYVQNVLIVLLDALVDSEHRAGASVDPVFRTLTWRQLADGAAQ